MTARSAHSVPLLDLAVKLNCSVVQFVDSPGFFVLGVLSQREVIPMFNHTQSDLVSALVIHQEIETVLLPPVSAAAFVEVPYSPTFLLDCSFPAFIRHDHEFALACGCGFDDYFEMMYEWSESDELVFVEKFYTWAEVVTFVIDEMFPCTWYGHETSLPFRAGFLLGWLSALALVNRSMAVMALDIVQALLVSRHCGLLKEVRV